MLAVSLVTAAASLLFAAVGWGGGGLPLYVPVSGLILAGILWAARPISTFLKIFIVMYALGFLFLAGMGLLGAKGLLPANVAALLPPPFMASATVAFAALVYGVSFVPLIRTIMGLTDPYFDAREREGGDFGFLSRFFPSRGAAARALVGFIVANNFIQVAMQIRLSLWYRDLFNALQAKDSNAFWYQMWWVFVPLLVCWIISQMLDVWSDSMLQIRWRSWLTRSYFSRWLEDGTLYRMQLLGLSADNPDQRIADDVDSFISQTMALSTRVLAQLATLVSFTVILWEISRGFVLPGTAIVVPGFLVWVVLAYAVIGTLVTHFIGRPLIRLDFLRQRVEANFRFSLARLREYSEQVALLSGGDAEKQRLGGRFQDIVANYIALLIRRLKLVGFTFSWQQMSVAFPYILTGSYYLAGKITLGQLQQGAQSFGQVNSAMSFFISSYQTLAAYKAIIDRLTTFNDNMSRAEATAASSPVAPRAAGSGVTISDLALKLPDGRTIATVPDFTFRPGERTLITGPSGSGKSTLLRALAGVWPFASGSIKVPEGKSMLLLPQQPYVAQGTLRAAVAYPAPAASFDDATVRHALRAVNLGHLIPELDVDDLWAQRLSGGEKQRLAVAHALLARPDWLFMDEATAAMDEALEGDIYRAVTEALPETTIVSVGHRSTLIDLHQRRVHLQPGEDGIARPREMERVAAE